MINLIHWWRWRWIRIKIREFVLKIRKAVARRLYRLARYLFSVSNRIYPKPDMIQEEVNHAIEKIRAKEIRHTRPVTKRNARLPRSRTRGLP